MSMRTKAQSPGRADLAGTTGVRPSPGAASSNPPSRLKSSVTPLVANVAAPGDGRTPAQACLGGAGTFKMRPAWPPALAAARGRLSAQILTAGTYSPELAASRLYRRLDRSLEGNNGKAWAANALLRHHLPFGAVSADCAFLLPAKGERSAPGCQAKPYRIISLSLTRQNKSFGC